MKLDGIKTLIFDMGGVLVDLKRHRCIEAFKKLGFSNIEIFLDNYRQQGVFLEIEEGKISNQEFYDRVRELIGNSEITDKQIYDAFIEFLVGIDKYKLDLLKSLKNKYKIFMLSNTNDIMINYVNDAFFGGEINDYFDKLYLSCEMKTAKPEPYIYKMLIEDSGITPCEALFLDDSPRNIETAKNLGLQTYLISEGEDLRNIFR